MDTVFESIRKQEVLEDARGPDELVHLDLQHRLTFEKVAHLELSRAAVEDLVRMIVAARIRDGGVQQNESASTFPPSGEDELHPALFATLFLLFERARIMEIGELKRGAEKSVRDEAK